MSEVQTEVTGVTSADGSPKINVSNYRRGS